MEDKKIKAFTDLDAWKEGHRLVLMIYNVTRLFPREEMFGLVSQMRRCAVSITSNIAEGFSRRSYREKVQFYHIAQGSLTELQNQLMIVKDVGFTEPDRLRDISDHSIRVHKIISGLIRASKNFGSVS